MIDSATDALALQHLFVLCCYGGAPFINYFAPTTNRHVASTRMVDPTDWMASDMSGSLLNATLHPQFVAQHPQLAVLAPRADSNARLDACDLYNLTFSSAADENLFLRFHGVFACRCPPARFGRSCEYTDEARANEYSLRSRLSTTTKQTKNIKSEITLKPRRITTVKTTATVTRKTEAITRNRKTRKLSPSQQSIVSTIHAKASRRVTRRLPFVVSETTSCIQNTQATEGNTIKNNSSVSRQTENMIPTPLRHSLDVALTAAINCSLIDCAKTPAINATIESVVATAMPLTAEGTPRWTFSTYLVIFLVVMLAIIGSFRVCFVMICLYTFNVNTGMNR